MVLSKSKIDAYAKLEEAIELIIKAHDSEDVKPGWILNGFLLVTSEVRVPEDHEIKDDDDDQDLKTAQGVYTRRGQSPILSYGLANEYIRHYNRTNE